MNNAIYGLITQTDRETTQERCKDASTSSYRPTDGPTDRPSCTEFQDNMGKDGVTACTGLIWMIPLVLISAKFDEVRVGGNLTAWLAIVAVAMRHLCRFIAFNLQSFEIDYCNKRGSSP